MEDKIIMDKKENSTTTPCRVCKEEIKQGSNKCIHCGSFQDWRRYINFSNTVLALLVALASVLSWGIPAVKEALKADKSEIVFGLQKVSYDGITMLVSNIGTKSGGLSAATLEIDFHLDDFKKVKKNKTENPNTIQLAHISEKESLNHIFSYRLLAVNSDDETVSSAPYLKPGESKQFVYRFDDPIEVSIIRISLSESIQTLVNRKALEDHKQLEFKALYDMQYMFSKTLDEFFKKSKCALKFTAINYNGETTKYTVNNSCDVIFPYFQKYAQIENPHTHRTTINNLR